MFTAKGLSAVGLMTALLAHSLAAEPLDPEPSERSTPDTIGFESVEDEHMSDTAITGALAPTAAGEAMEVDEDIQVVEPVWFSEEFMQARGMEPEDLMQRREYLLNSDSIRGSGPAQVSPRAFENRVYSPSSSVTTDHRPRD